MKKNIWSASEVVWEKMNIKEEISQLYQEKRLITEEISITPIIDKAGGAYNWTTGGIYDPSHTSFRYSKFDVEGKSRVHAYGGYAYPTADGYALIAFTDASENALGHSTEDVAEITIDVPANAKYAYVNGLVDKDTYLKSIEESYQSLTPEIDILNELALSNETKPTPNSTKLIKSGTVAQKFTEIDLELGLDIEKKEFVGYILNDLSIAADSNFHSYISSKIPVKEGEIYTYRGNSNSLAVGIFLLSDDIIVSTDYFGGLKTIVIPSGINYLMVASFDRAANQIILSLTKKYNLQQVLQQKRENESTTPLTPIIDNGSGVYNWISGGILSGEGHPDWKYSKFDVSNIRRVHVTGKTYVVSDGYALIAFVDENGNALEHLTDSVNEATLNVPSNAKYAYVNGGTVNTYHISLSSVSFVYTSLIPEIDNLNERVSSLENLEIICTGDSVTEGMSMPRGDDYPGQLAAMFDAANYNVKVKNWGNSGEDAPSIISRTGGIGIYFKETVQLPQDTSWVQINVNGNNLLIALTSLSNVDYSINYTLAKEDITEVFIDGNWYDLKVENQNWSVFTTYIRKKSINNTASSIPANAILIPKIGKQPKRYILFAGYNGRGSLNYEKWEYLMKCGLNQSDGNGIVIGSQIAIWSTWNDIMGTTDTEKYQSYRRKALASFGNKFIDLYDLFFSHALDYSLAGGFFTDKTQEELDLIQAKLNEHIVPAEFSYDNAHEGNVHLNKAGYYVVAKLVYDRILAINLLNI